MKRTAYILFLLSAISCADIGEPSQATGHEDDNRPLKIVFITDTHYGTTDNNNYTRRCVNDINSLDSVDFVLMGGDLANTGHDAQIIGAKATFDMLKCPYWVVSGNHDSKWSESGCTTFPELFGYTHFEFEAGGYRFVGCDSGPEMRMGNALVSKESLKWLKSLKPGKPMIFLNHYPFDDNLSNWFELRRELIRLDCRLAIAGHVHYNGKRDYDGLPGFTGTTSNGVSEYARYNIITIKDGVVKVSERRVYEDRGVTVAPWFTTELHPVTDKLEYDADGLPSNYKLFKYSDNANYPQAKVVWRKEEDSNIWSGFAREGNTAWYATSSGKLTAIDVKTGRVIWSRKFDGKIFSTPALSNDNIVIGCTDGYVYCLQASTGNKLWEYAIGKIGAASPIIKEEHVYIGSSDGTFRCFNLNDGKLAWKCGGIQGYCDATPAFYESQVVFGTWGGTLYSVDIATGKLKWQWQRSGSILTSPGACPPLISGDRVFVACPDRRTYCIDAKNGKLLFLVDAGRESIALSEDKQKLYIKSMYGEAIAVNAQIPTQEVTGTFAADSPSAEYWKPDNACVLQSSQALWSVVSGLGSDIGSSALTECGGMLIMPSDKGNIHALDADTGQQLWIHKLGIGLANPATAWAEDGKIYILASTADGYIELLETTK